MTGFFDLSYKKILRIGGVSCMLLIAYSLITLLVMSLIGGPPETIEECFSILNENRFFGLLRLDILTVFFMPFYYLLFYSLYTALKNTDYPLTSVSTILTFAGITLFLATPSVFSYMYLSDKFALAASEIVKNQLLAAGESVLASDMWHGSGAKIGGLLLQTGALLFSISMLKSTIFGKFTAVTGIATHGLDLLHIIFAFFLPTLSNILMFIAGPLYLLWFPLVGFRLLKLGRREI